MKRILSRLALLGIVAAGTLGAGVSTSWSCAPGSTDCSMTETGSRGDRFVRPDVGGGRPDWRPGPGAGRPDWRPDPGAGRHEWRPDNRPGRPDWRPDRGHVPRYDRHRRPGEDSGRWREHEWRRDGWRYRPRSGVYFNYYVDRWPGYYDDGYYYDPGPRYVAPRYRIRLSEAHIEWCYARYKTYRASDNTFKPTRHTRRQCISPYS
jgi:hypothetical protein